MRHSRSGYYLMLDWLFRSRATVLRDLEVAQLRLEFAERDVTDLRARLRSVENEYARFRDQSLARLGTIAAPITETSVSTARPPRNPFDALAITDIGEPASPFPPVAMRE